MSRFVKINGVGINVNNIKAYWRAEEHRALHVELDSGAILKDTCPLTESYIEGWEYIVQVIPCVKPLYQRYRGENGEIWESPIYYLGLCASGYVRPLEIYGCEGVMFADDASNYLGLYDVKMENEEVEDNEQLRQ